MDATFLCCVSELKKQQDYLARLNEVVYFRRNQMIEREQMQKANHQLKEVRKWIHNFGKLINKDAHKYSNQCDILIRKFERKFNKFARRIAVFDEDEIASDSYDDEFALETSSSEN